MILDTNSLKKLIKKKMVPQKRITPPTIPDIYLSLTHCLAFLTLNFNRLVQKLWDTLHARHPSLIALVR